MHTPRRTRTHDHGSARVHIVDTAPDDGGLVPNVVRQHHVVIEEMHVDFSEQLVPQCQVPHIAVTRLHVIRPFVRRVAVVADCNCAHQCAG